VDILCRRILHSSVLFVPSVESFSSLNARKGRRACRNMVTLQMCIVSVKV